MNTPESHLAVLAEGKRKDIQQRLLASLSTMVAIAVSDKKRGLSKCSISLTRAELLRRAGKIDKNTLKAPYHAELKLKIEKRLGRLQLLFKDRASISGSAAVAKGECSFDTNHYAQLLLAADLANEALLTTIERLKRENSELKSHNDELRAAGGNVVFWKDRQHANDPNHDR